MKTFALVLTLVVVAISESCAQGIEDKAWNVRLEQHFPPKAFLGESYLLFLNSQNHEFVFLPSDGINKRFTAKYSVTQAGESYTINLMEGWLLEWASRENASLIERASCEIVLQTETSGTFALKDEQSVLINSGTIELWTECNEHEVERDPYRTDLLITMTDDWILNPATATKLVWNGDYGCFHTLTMDSFESEGEHFATGEFFL